MILAGHSIHFETVRKDECNLNSDSSIVEVVAVAEEEFYRFIIETSSQSCLAFE